MLADSIEPASLPKYVPDDRFLFSQKLDGERVLIRVTPEGEVTPLDRRGDFKVKGIPLAVRRALNTLPDGPWFLDGELLGDELWLFDLPMAGDLITPADPFHKRLAALEDLYSFWKPSGVVQLLSTARQPEQKVALVRAVLEAGGEGVIVRDAEACYMAGRRTSALRKAKFLKDADVVVTGRHINGKDNLSIGAFDETGRMVDLGTVTAMAGDGATLQVGEVCTVQYLYANHGQEGLRLVQVTKPLRRIDKRPDECTIASQLVLMNKQVVCWGPAGKSS